MPKINQNIPPSNGKFLNDIPVIYCDIMVLFRGRSHGIPYLDKAVEPVYYCISIIIQMKGRNRYVTICAVGTACRGFSPSVSMGSSRICGRNRRVGDGTVCR